MKEQIIAAENGMAILKTAIDETFNAASGAVTRATNVLRQTCPKVLEFCTSEHYDEDRIEKELIAKPQNALVTSLMNIVRSVRGPLPSSWHRRARRFPRR